MSTNKPLEELIHIPRPQQPSSRRRSKSRIKLKKLKTTTNTLIIRTPNLQNVSNADSGLIASEDDNQVYNPSFFSNYDQNIDKKPEVLQTVLQHVLSETQQAPYAAYKSTLANLSKGLAAMNEGEYLGWEGNDDESKSPITAYTMMNPARRRSENPQRPQQQLQNMNNINNSSNNTVLLPLMRNHGQTPVLKASKSEKELPAVRSNQSREYRSKNSGEHYRSDSNYVVDAYNGILHTESSAKNDIRWKEYNTLGEDLEFLKTEESLETTKLNSHQRVTTETEHILIPLNPIEPKMKNSRSASMKNRKTLMQEFIEWKKALETNRRALEKRLINKSEKGQTPEPRKEDFVLPKLNIGDEANKGFDKGYREWELVRRQKSVEGVSIKPQTKLGAPKLSRRGKSGLSGLKLEHSREEVTYEKSFMPIAGEKEFRDEMLNPMENHKPMNEIRSLSNVRMRPREGVIIWDELMNGMPRYGEEGYLMQGEYEKALQDHWKMQGLVPKIGIKRDILVKKHLGSVGGKDIVKEDSRELSRENLKDSKGEIGKGVKSNKEVSDKSKRKLAQLKHQNAALTEMLIAQTIINQRLRMLQDYGSKGREDKNEIIRTQEKIRLSILRKGSESGLNVSRNIGVKEEKSKKTALDMKSGGMVSWEELNFSNKRAW